MTNLFDKLNSALMNFVSLTDTEIIALRDAVTIRTFKKGDFVARQGEACKHVGLLTSGIFRVYHLDQDKEITNYFNVESRNPFVSSFASFLSGRPSKEFVVALEPAEMVMIHKDALLNLYDRFHTLERLGRLMAEYNYILALDRIEQLQYLPAKERYERFLKIYPNLINQIPNHYIASYLGVTPEWLSRIRKNLAQ